MADTPEAGKSAAPKAAARKAAPKAKPAAKPKAAAPAAAKVKPAATKPTKKPAPAAAAPRKPIREQISASTETIRAEAQRKAGEIGDEVTRLYGQASDRALEAARAGKTRAAGGLENLARAIDDSAATVDDKLGKQYGDFARSAAQQVASLAGTLDEQDLDELVASTRDFVRKSPAVAIGSAAVVGFMLARLLRGGRNDA